MRASEFIIENFADGKKPGRKGLAKRSGVNTKASVSSLRKTAKNSTGEKARMAHWLANMKAGRAKKEDVEQEGFLSFLKTEPPKKKWDPKTDSRVISNKKDNDNWIKLLLDKHRRGIELTDREWRSIEQWKLNRAMKGEDVDEGWKDWVAGAAMGAASLGAAGNADASVKHKDLSKPAIHQSVKKKEIKPIAPPTASKKELAKSVTGNSHEVYLKKAAEKAGIQGQELVAFLSQCAHETLDFKHMKEIGGSLDFRKYDPKYAPKKAKQLGNKQVGDGAKYKGRGYIQLTGRDNYKKAGQALGLPLEQKPELVEKPEVAAKVAVWYWKTRVANKVDSFKDTQNVTKNINPGLKHLDQRKEKQQAFQIAMR
jgi:predicted chitinase